MDFDPTAAAAAAGKKPEEKKDAKIAKADDAKAGTTKE
jgi:hypothetical protein